MEPLGNKSIKNSYQAMPKRSALFLFFACKEEENNQIAKPQRPESRDAVIQTQMDRHKAQTELGTHRLQSSISPVIQAELRRLSGKKRMNGLVGKKSGQGEHWQKIDS